MNIAIKHSGTTITGFVKSYERVHRICTGIGTLTIDIVRTINRQFNPWDSIDIYENGSLQVRYYISSTRDSIPEGIITLECQDISKRLVDYFIPDSYTIDYPSYTRYWIEKFLAEAGISYSFTTTSQGNLLSNYTQLGLAPAYEQILTLLQLSGWYMYFDGTGTAIIGELSTDLATVAGTVGTSDILQISKVEDDKMLRNRAVVWGAYDPIRQEHAYADVKVTTRWNYDSRDERTMVVSNGNIPNRSSAVGIANNLIKEFARITVEKHIIMWGARNYDLGRALRVRTRTWTGKGLITTFSVKMDKDGLTTSVILDERCPRLFGFFDFGDYVYVGTYGHGVWRKHIRFDPTWYNFSTGLTDLAITDLHINYEVFGAVSASGDLYYTPTNEGPWQKLVVESLMSSQEDNVISGGAITLVPFSGIHARATIVDKLTNLVKFGVDNYSGLNYGDYFMTSSGISGSGIISSGVSYRGWILEYDPYTGQLATESGSGIYPINISGNYNLTVLDLENDGYNDYVSVATSGSMIERSSTGYNFGKHNSSVYPQTTQDSSALVGVAFLGNFDSLGQSLVGTLSIGGAIAVSVYDNEFIDEREILYRAGGAFHRVKITKSVGSMSTSTLNSPGHSISGKSPFNITKIGTELYRCWYGRNVGGKSTTTTTTSSFIMQVSYVDWDTSTNTIGSENVIVDYSIAENPDYGTSNEAITFSSIVLNNKIYTYAIHIVNTNGFLPGSTIVANYIKIHRLEVNLVGGSGSASLVTTLAFTDKGIGLNTPQWFVCVYPSQSISFNGQEFVFQRGGIPNVAFYVRDSHNDNPLQVADPYEAYNYLVYSSNGTDFTLTEIQHADLTSDPDFVSNAAKGNLGVQLTGERFLLYIVSQTGSSVGASDKALIFNGDSVSVVDMVTIPFQYVSGNIYPLFGTYDNYYIAKSGSSWYFCNPHTLAVGSEFIAPSTHTLIKPYSTTDSFSIRYYWQANNNTTFKNEILQTTETSVTKVISPTGNMLTTQSRCWIVGNFFMEFNGSSSGATLAYVFLNNIDGLVGGTRYLVLQRDGADFHIIEEESYPIRLDISNSTPLLTVGSGDTSFHSHIIGTQELTTILAGQQEGRTVQDYRYSLLEPSSGISGFDATASGLGLGMLGLYVDGSGIYADNILSYSGFQLMYTIPSGYGNRIETSNAAPDGQYIFVTTSGDSPMFYQKDPTGALFMPYSGLPVSRATIIRLDDFL